MNTYAVESTLTKAPDRVGLSLATALAATPHGFVDHPVFFTGFLARPDVAAAGLLAVADVAGARYADAGLMKRLANLDPLVTASGDRLRFESFSACNGVHARFDLLASGIEAAEVGFGTTNVDINQPLRNALTRVSRTELLHLAVGHESLTASSPQETHIEEKVGLPDRWVRGCAEIPALTSRMTQALTLEGPAIAQLMRELPSGTPPGPVLYLVAIGRTLRLTPHRIPGSIPITGTSRLASAARITRFATSLTIYSGANDTSGWVFTVPGGRLTLVLSAGPYRGFSGEGGLLILLADPDAAESGERLLRELCWSPEIDPSRLATSAGLSDDQVHAGLAWLSASGRVGYDLSEAAYFHRELPVEADAVLRRSPRLRGARRLIERNAVTTAGAHWSVRGNNDTYQVSRQECSCPWGREYKGSRGPCKHVLAVAILTNDQVGVRA